MANKKLSFDKISKKMDKLSKYGGMIDEIDYSEITEWIDTGNYALNAAISGSIFKGVPNNRIVGFAGESGCLHPDSKITVYKMKTKTKKRKVTQL